MPALPPTVSQAALDKSTLLPPGQPVSAVDLSLTAACLFHSLPSPKSSQTPYACTDQTVLKSIPQATLTFCDLLVMYNSVEIIFLLEEGAETLYLELYVRILPLASAQVTKSATAFSPLGYQQEPLWDFCLSSQLTDIPGFSPGELSCHISCSLSLPCLQGNQRTRCRFVLWNYPSPPSSEKCKNRQHPGCGGSEAFLQSPPMLCVRCWGLDSPQSPCNTVAYLPMSLMTF